MSDTQQIAVPHAERLARLANWTPWPFDNPSLIGHADVTFSGGWRINSIPIFRRGDGSLSAGVPSIPQLDTDGRVKLRDGKKQYSAVLSFETAAGRERWNRAVLGALAEAGIGAPALAEAPQ